MIIECQTCRARFRLDESRIKGRGARVKCRKCGDNIVVLKDSAPPPAPGGEGLFDLGSAVRDPVEKSPQTPSPAGNLIPFATKARPEKDEVDLAFDRVLTPNVDIPSTSSGEPEMEIPLHAEADTPLEIEIPAGREARPELDLGALTLDLAPEEKLDLPPTTEGETPTVAPSAEFRGEGSFLINDSDALDFLQEREHVAASKTGPEVNDISLDITSTPPDAESFFPREPDPLPVPPDDSSTSPTPPFDWAAPVPEEISLEGNVTPPAAESVTEIPPYREAEPVPAPPVEPPVRRGSPAQGSPRQRSSAGPAVAVLLAFLLAVGGYLGLTTSGRKTLERVIPGAAALWGGGAAPEAPKYELRNVIGYYEKSSSSSRTLVIKGQVANISKAEKSGIRVQATLLDNTDAVLAQEAVYAGNILSGDAIRKGDRGALLKSLGNRFGERLVNMNVAPNKSIPFMVLFFDAPAAMDSYKLEALDSE